MGALIAIAATAAAGMITKEIEAVRKKERMRRFPVHLTNYTSSQLLLQSSDPKYGTFAVPPEAVIPEENHCIYCVRGGGQGGDLQMVFKLDSTTPLYIGFAIEFAVAFGNFTGNNDIVRCTVKGDSSLGAQGAWAGGKSVSQPGAGGITVQAQWGDTIRLTVR